MSEISQSNSEKRTPDGEDVPQDSTSEELTAQIELLLGENRRLRSEYRRARRRDYRRTAVGMALVALLAALSGIAFAGSRSVLFSLSGIGLFGAVLLYYMMAEHPVPASVGETAYSSYRTLGQALVAELGLQENRIYVPTTSGHPSGFANVRLFVPEQQGFVVPSADELQHVVVAAESERERGLSVYPIGAALLREFKQAGDLTTDVTELAVTVADVLVEDLKLVERAVPDMHATEGELTMRVTSPRYQDIDSFDHPVPSFVASAFADALDRPVTVDITAVDAKQPDWLVTCRWSTPQTEQ